MGFMNRRKIKEQEQTDAQASDPQIVQPSSSRRSKKGKKNAPEPKFELDLSTALPATESFRTSFLMPNLSARFSMLREQDDPSTKIGKANDDSVLFPKRASRLNLFNHNPLTDIAEVSSIRSSLVKPPFAREDRVQSVGSDGYASDQDGSIMNRAKPGEGNNLFGGRQKLYKIAVGSSSTKTLPEADSSEREASGMSGRVLYQNDVSLSMFQQIREKEREERRLREQHHQSDSSNNTEVDEVEAASSPSTTAFSKDRGTNSSTTSGPLGRRTSTAATSVASESRGSFFAENRSATSLVTSTPIVEEVAPLDRASAVQRKLYGQAVEQSSPTHRAVRNVLEGSTRPRAPTYERKPNALSPSKSASNLSGKYSRSGPLSPPPTFRTASPPPSVTPPAMVPMDLGLRDNGPSPGQAYGSLPPLSPPSSDGEDVLTYANSLQPEDRGKATAMGLFNRPQRQYDEQQFSQRQVQMHEGQISPLPQRLSPVRRDGNASPVPQTESLEESQYSPTDSGQTRQTESRYSPIDNSLSRLGYYQSPRLPSNSVSSRTPPTVAAFRAPHHQPKVLPETYSRAQAQANSFTRHQNVEHAAMEGERNMNRVMESSPRKTGISVPNTAQNGTFLDNFSPSDDELDTSFELAQALSRRPPSGVHPALRDGTIDFEFGTSVSSTHKSSDTGTSASDETERALWTGGMNHAISEPSPSSSDENDGDHVDLTTSGGLGLSGMIRSHLRHDSDKSSIYPPTLASQPGASALESPRLGTSTRSQNQPESIHSNPWEFDDVHARANCPEVPEETQDSTSTMYQNARQILSQATAFQNQAKTKAQQVLGDEAPLSAGNAPVGRTWQEEMRLRHQRDGSTETKKERDEFLNELAERRKRVQETVKSKFDTSNRPASPMRHTDRIVNGATNPLSTLKHKTSKSSIKPWQPEHPTKAMKMLGITNGGAGDMSPDVPPEDQWKEEEERMLQDFARRKPRSPSTAMTGPRPPYNGAPRAASPRTTPYEDSERQRQRSVTPTTAMNPRRGRAESTTSGRSKSRGGRPREDIDRAMAAGTANYGGLYDKSTKTPSVISLPRPSLDGGDQPLYERSASAMSNSRQRSNSRPAGPSYFDNPPSMRGYNEPISATELPPPLPIQAYSANSTPPLSSPALSNVSTPTLPSYPNSHNGGFPPPLGHRSATGLAGRKKSVTKDMISDPTFVSTTSNVPAVSLPAPPDFRPHELASPPLPVMNPRRRRPTATQTLFAAPGNDRVEMNPGMPSMPESPNRPHHQFEERSTFSDEGEQRQFKQRARLRKTSSEGGNLNARARQQAMMASSPAMPRFPPGIGYSKPPPAHAMNGGMF
jgi:hypothetical protein